MANTAATSIASRPAHAGWILRTAGTGGLGGGGAGSNTDVSATAGTNGTGGGGGGTGASNAPSAASGKGGDGCVIIAYASTYSDAVLSPGLTKTTAGGNTIYTAITGSGSITW